ncbi:MAG TPA: DUF1841 family protein [Gammaproteobacteria bacterium]|jgi:hypothetical protein|nr:DUF1841 family protein [Gammaproteobacteria bacterium]
MNIHGESRSDTRQTFFDAWAKMQEGRPLTALETTIADVIRMHPEYHALLAQGIEVLDKDWLPEGGETNPFLHMGMHIAIREQLSIDRPPGIKAVYDALLEKTGAPIQAEHLMLECLGETLWRAQREGRMPDEQLYLRLVRQRAGLA